MVRKHCVECQIRMSYRRMRWYGGVYRVLCTFPGEMVVGLGVGELVGVLVALLTKVTTAALAEGKP